MKNSIKVLLAALLLCQITLKSNAQVSGGITAGISTGSVSVSSIPGTIINSFEGDNIMGFNAGLFARFDISPFYVKPELLLEYKKGDVSISQSDDVVKKQSFSMEKLAVPLIFGFNIIGPLSIEAGPVYNYILGTKNEVLDSENIAIKKSGLGYRAGASAEFGRLNIFVHYQGIYNKGSAASGDATFKSPNELIFGVGIGLGKEAK